MERRHFNHFCIAGFTYYEGPIVFNKLDIGAELQLVAETENKYDPKAVALYFEGHKLGFVPRNENKEMCKLLEMGYTDIFEARIQQIDKTLQPENQIGVIVYIKKNTGIKEECL